jgi:hypothetical protein
MSTGVTKVEVQTNGTTIRMKKAACLKCLIYQADLHVPFWSLVLTFPCELVLGY